MRKIYVGNDMYVSNINNSLEQKDTHTINANNRFGVVKSYVMHAHTVCCHSEDQTTQALNKNG